MGAPGSWPTLAAALLGLLGGSGAALAQSLPSVASINLCADQLVLSLADPAQVLSVSWLAADPEESMLAAEAGRHALNYGSAEELLRLAPDVIIAGSHTNAPTRRLMRRLGYRVVEIEPAETLADIERNLLLVAAALERRTEAERLIAAMRAAAPATVPAPLIDAVVVRPGGFTVSAGSLADHLMRQAGLSNVAAAQGLDRWGSLSIETLLRSAPDLLIVTGYRQTEASLANAYLEHRALRQRLKASPAVTVAAKYWSCGAPPSLESVRILRQAVRGLEP